MCHFNFIVLLPPISPWTQIWIQAFIVSYQNLTFKSVKKNCCFRNQRWDAVKSRQALKEGCIKSTNQNAIFFARIYQTPIWILIGTQINLFLIGYVYLQTRRHATQMNWINTKVKCIVHMGLSNVKYCANLLFHSDQSECYIQASKKDSLFLFFASLNLSTCLFIRLELMVQC